MEKKASKKKKSQKTKTTSKSPKDVLLVNAEELPDSEYGAHHSKPITEDEDNDLLSYEVEKTGTQLEDYIEDIADTVRIGLDQSISILTPWFFNNMPRMYYQTTPRPEKIRHLSAVITGHVFETKQTVELWDRNLSKVTYIGPGGDNKILSQMAQKLLERKVKLGSIYFSRDKLLFLSTFFCNDYVHVDAKNKRINEKVDAARKSLIKEFPEEKESIETYVKQLDNDFVMYGTANRIFVTYKMYRHMLSHEGAHTELEMIPNTNHFRLSIGIKNVEPSEILESMIELIQRYGFNVYRAFVVRFDSEVDNKDSAPISVMYFILEQSDRGQIDFSSVPFKQMIKAVRTLSWVDVDEYSAFARMSETYSINAANLLRSVGNWVHLFLGKNNNYVYSQYKVFQTLYNNLEYTEDLVKLFRIKFDPNYAGKDNRHADYQSHKENLAQNIGIELKAVDADIFREAINFIDNILITNYFMTTKTGLAFRMDSAVLNPMHYAHKPFGIYYMVGRHYRCFQVRWKDIARGGLRVVIPKTGADYEGAFSGCFDEVYGLSYAQQMKNKDIPEGGSKAVLVLQAGGNRDQAVKGAVNALLDLLVTEDETHDGTAKAQMVKYYQKPEIIYLGPDENITNELINWIVEQAERRGYKYARAFMSSKPGDGINHKEFGITSEGVNVYVENVIPFLGIDPKREKFTVKITGGPDGDVAGNELNILHREYGEKARVVSVSDGFGAAYDPEGLAWDELLRLFKEGLPINNFSKKSLSKNKDAFVINADTKENIKIRNQLFAKVYADIFIPAGGRPYTVNGDNWTMCIGSDGIPTMRAVVEGANIFFTPEARDKLQESGVIMIKDSSANKTGVIASSFEIIGSLVLSQDEFLAIKKEYVEQVIAILREKADLEAKLLLSTYQRLGGEKTLVQISTELSAEINMVTDAILDELTPNTEAVLSKKQYQEIILRHCPPILVEKYRDRIFQKLPAPHMIAILSAFMASYVIYREGMGWLNTVPSGSVSESVKTYMEQDKVLAELIESIEKSNIADKDRVKMILRESGARELTIQHLGQLLV